MHGTNRTKLPWLASFFSHYRARTLLWILLFALPSAGCMESHFSREFSRMEGQPLQPDKPLIGAWQGTWESNGDGSHRTARAAIVSNARGHYDMLLMLTDFDPVPGDLTLAGEEYSIGLQDVSVSDAPDGTATFAARIRLRTIRDGLVAEAMTFRGNFNTNRLEIEFGTNDAIRELQAGRIVLNRAAPR